MIDKLDPKTLFIIAGVLLFIGFIVPLFMVIKWIPMVLWLEMIIAVMQFVGIAIGILASVLYVKDNRGDNKKY